VRDEWRQVTESYFQVGSPGSIAMHAISHSMLDEKNKAMLCLGMLETLNSPMAHIIIKTVVLRRSEMEIGQALRERTDKLSINDLGLSWSQIFATAKNCAQKKKTH
jgi:hypothetical protein